MILVKPSAWFEPNGIENKEQAYKTIERIGRTCYKSEDKTEEGSATRFVKMILKRKHYSVLEHVSLTARFVFDRGVSHELVRHRLAAYSQESTRFCNYMKGSHVQFVAPHWLLGLCGDHGNPLFRPHEITVETLEDVVADACVHYQCVHSAVMADTDKERVKDFLGICLRSEEYYLNQVSRGYKPEDARGGLAHFVKTEIVKTANLRSWLHVFSLRTSKYAHPDMRVAMDLLYTQFAEEFPELAQHSEMSRKKEIAKAVNAAKKRMLSLDEEIMCEPGGKGDTSIRTLFGLLAEEYGEYM